MKTITLTQLLDNIQDQLQNNLCSLEDTKNIFYNLLNISIEEITENNLYNELCEHQEEVIYYKSAMEFLTEYDSSLHTCMELAHEYGYAPKDLNSELLASLLKTKFVHEEQNSNIKIIMESIYEYINN